MLSTRPLKHELDSMSIVELYENLHHHPEYGVDFRRAINERKARGERLTTAATFHDEPVRRNTAADPLDVRPLVSEIRKNPDTGLGRLCKTIKTSGWDFIDVLAPPHGMKSTPEHVANFLDDMIYNDTPYSELENSAQKLMKTIRDAYVRWYRLKMGE